MIKSVVCFLLAISVCDGEIGRPNPLSKFWKEHAQEKYAEVFKDETALALLCAPSFHSKIENTTGHGLFNRYLIYVTSQSEDHIIHLRDLYQDNERNFSFDISGEDLKKLERFFATALKTLETSDRIGGDGITYILRAQGAENEFGYFWSPELFSYTSDIATIIRMLRDDCIRCIDGDFSLSSDTEDFMTIAERTPDSMREEFIERSESVKAHMVVDPFRELSEEQKNSKVEASYLTAQLKLQFEHERKILLGK